MRVVIAIIAGLVIFGLGFSVIRGFAGPRGRAPVGGGVLDGEIAKPVPAGVRILFWCETCGTEVLLVRAGTENPPRHCGEPMTRREEILRDG
jgi:hypothetical protein